MERVPVTLASVAVAIHAARRTPNTLVSALAPRWRPHNNSTPATSNASNCACGIRLRSSSIGGICKDCRTKLVYNGIVDATPVREHLGRLRGLGVGYKQVADAANVGRTTLQEVMSGRAKVIRAESLRRVLEADGQALADAARVPAASARGLITRLLDDGFTRSQIAQRTGLSRATIDSDRDLVLARTELLLRRLYNLVHHGDDWEDGEETPAVPAVCTSCGFSHEHARDRRALLARLPTDDTALIMERFRCIYGWDTKGTGYRKLGRDLAAIRCATRIPAP